MKRRIVMALMLGIALGAGFWIGWLSESDLRIIAQRACIAKML
jgi:hypothetical protein